MPTTAKNRKREASLRESASAWLFMAPFLFFYLGFLLFPILRGFLLSFFKSSLGKKDVFIGFANYAALVLDAHFWESLFNTVFFVAVSTPVIMTAGFILAQFVAAGLRGTTFVRASYFVSYVLSMSVVTSLWTFIFQPYSGLITNLLKPFDAPELFWLDTKWLVWLAVLIATTWWTVGFNMVLFLAGLQNIPREVYESAEIDGAGKLQTIFKITIPMLRPVLILTLLLQMIASFKLFGQTYLMAQGGPGTHTRTLVHYIYETAFVHKKMGYASTLSLALFVIIMGQSLLQGKLFSSARSAKAGGNA